MSISKKSIEPKMQSNQIYVVTNYFYVGGEPDDSDLDILTIENTYDKVQQNVMETDV